ncbi:unnamed protein product [Sphagnum troendelagicum]
MRSLAHNTLRGKGASWSSGMGLGRIDKLIHSHGPAHNPHKVVSAKLEHLWCWDSHGQHGHTRLITARTWGSHHLPPYSILCDAPRRLHPNGSFSRDSRDSRPRVPKSRPAGLLGLLEPHNFSSRPRIEVRSEAKL